MRNTTFATLMVAFCLAFASTTQAQDAGYTWLVDRQTYTVETDGRWVGLIEVERKAHDAQTARNGGRIDLSYNASLQKLEILEAATVKADGRRLPVEEAKIFDIAPQVAREVAYYTDVRTRSIVFPDVEAGDSIRYVYRLTKSGHSWPGFAWNLSWTTSARTVLSERIFDHPASMRLNHEHHHVDYRKETAGERVREMFSFTNRTATADEAGEISSFDWGPRFAISSHGSYAEIAEYFGRLHADAAAVTPDIAELANQIVGSASDRTVQARRLYDWVTRNIRYVSVAIGGGMLTPRAPSETVKTRYGDCKDLTALLAALLAARGIASEPALIASGVNRYTVPETPVPAFNHVMLNLPELGVYLDPTWQHASFGVLTWGHHDKPVLHAAVGKSRLARVPAGRTDDNYSETHVEATVSAEGRITGLSRETARGTIAAELRGNALDTSSPKAAAQLRLFGSPGTGKWTRTTKDPATDQVELFGEFRLSDEVDLGGGEALLPPVGLRFLVRPGLALVGLHDGPRKRPFPCHAGRQVEIIEVALPGNVRPLRLPADRNWKTSFATYRSSYSFGDGTLRVRREFVSSPQGQVCRPEQSRELVGLQSNIRRDLRAVVVFGPRS
jgi:transglutaminase-like putative cysteine protease